MEIDTLEATIHHSKKLIEVAIPLEAINAASAREKSIRHGHPSTLHLWWARRPLAAARAVIFAQMVDDPSAHPELFPTPEAQEQERERLFSIMKELVLWENTTNEAVLQRARDEIWRSWRRTCAANAQHPRAAELFNPDQLPAFHDPFAGGGSLPLEAQRLGLKAYASDLNPVAVLINKAMIEIPPQFAGQPPINPEARAEQTLVPREWPGTTGLAEDIRYYGQWMRDEAEKRIGHLYPKIRVTDAMAADRPDLLPYVGKELTVIAWLWARTVNSPNPAFAHVPVPLASTFMLSTRTGKEAYVEPIIEGDTYRFTVKVGRPPDLKAAQNGTKLSRGANFKCLLSGMPIEGNYIKAEGQAGRMGARMMAIVAEGTRQRIYLPPTPEMEAVALQARPEWRPEGEMPNNPRWFSPPYYGLPTWADLFTDRQLVALTTFSDLIAKVFDVVNKDAAAFKIDTKTYATVVGVYLGIGVSRLVNRSASLNFWDNKGGMVQQVFARQALPMTWDFAEGNPFSQSTGNFVGQLQYLTDALSMVPAKGYGECVISDAAVQDISQNKVVSTDPPYYDNVGYADLSDFFYVWLRKALYRLCPTLFSMVATPKAKELIMARYRQNDRSQAEDFFTTGMTQAIRQLALHVHPALPLTIYYAFKQTEIKEDTGRVNSGWQTFLTSLAESGFVINGTWPFRTEYTGNLKRNVNALASSIVLVCRRRAANAPVTDRRRFINALKAELPPALAHLRRGNIAPVDLAQAAIGPGMAVFTRYARVLDAAGNDLTVRAALGLINQILDETLAEQEGDYDAHTRWALTWFEQMGFAEGEYGSAETLSKAKNTSISSLAEAGIVQSSRGIVRLLRPDELAPDWQPAADKQPTAWEIVHQLIRVLEAAGEAAAATLVAALGQEADIAHELAYHLYNLCDRNKRTTEARRYNGLIQSWPEVKRLAEQVGGEKRQKQSQLDFNKG